MIYIWLWDSDKASWETWVGIQNTKGSCRDFFCCWCWITGKNSLNSQDFISYDVLSVWYITFWDIIKRSVFLFRWFGETWISSVKRFRLPGLAGNMSEKLGQNFGSERREQYRIEDCKLQWFGIMFPSFIDILTWEILLLVSMIVLLHRYYCTILSV